MNRQSVYAGLAVLCVLGGLLPVTILADNQDHVTVTLVRPEGRQALPTQAHTVGEALRDAGLDPRSYRKVFPSPGSRIMDGLQIFLYPRSTARSDSVTTYRAEDRIIRSDALPRGRRLVVKGGRPGIKRNRAVLRKAVPKIVMVGQTEYKREHVRRLVEKRTLTLEATAYSPHAASTYPYNDGYAALGIPAGYGVAAVDPQVIPLGTWLYVEGYGYALAADVGGDIEGRRIDLCFDRHDNALRYGRQIVQVHILG